MKYKFWPALFVFCISQATTAQDLKKSEQQLSAVFSKITYYAFNRGIPGHDDSLEYVNNLFQRKLIQVLRTQPASITYPFKKLDDSGLVISHSQDGKFSIYSWDTWTGGTMHFFRNVFQYKSGNKVFAKTLLSYTGDEYLPDGVYQRIHDIQCGDTVYYVTESHARFSSALLEYTVKIFSVEHGKLNDKVKLIKTSSGLQNELNYEVDFSGQDYPNTGRNLPDYDIQYDPVNKIISIPLITEKKGITGKRILYQFTGRYFEKR